jgi:hypothetical protein
VVDAEENFVDSPDIKVDRDSTDHWSISHRYQGSSSLSLGYLTWPTAG